MSFFNRVPFGETDQVKKSKGHIRVALTPEGQEAADSLEGTGKKYAILSALREKNRPIAVKDLAKETHMDSFTLIGELKELEKDRLIQRVKI